MRLHVRSGLTLVSLSAALMPMVVLAQAPAGYTMAPAGYVQPQAPAMVPMMDADGKVVMVPAPAGQPSASPAPAPVPVVAMKPAAAAAPHQHNHKLFRGKTLCANCARKEQMAMSNERIVACAHSKNGVCPSCQALLALPGAITMGAPASAAPSPAGEAPGRAVVSNMPVGMPGNAQLAARSAAVTAVYDPSNNPEPTPIGVMQTSYNQPGAMPAARSSIPTAGSLQPGHAMVESMGASPAPFQQKPTSSSNPHVLGHIFGWSGMMGDYRDYRDQHKGEAHASIPYNNEGTTINELPSSMVYGRP